MGAPRRPGRLRPVEPGPELACAGPESRALREGAHGAWRPGARVLTVVASAAVGAVRTVTPSDLGAGSTVASLHCAGRTRGKVSFPEQRDPRRCHAVVVTAAANPGARRSLRSLLSTPPGECLEVGSPGHRGVPYVPPGGSPSYGLGSARFPTSSPASVIFHFFFNCYFLNGSHAEVCVP